MRVHRLRVTAFGPFAGACEVDLDALAAGGLFLLHGPTGAGKTSVLDAVCFALYGNVPGGRQGGRLRSDHAAAGVAPEVVCEFSAAGRRLEVTRSPAWERPKRRGTGTTLEQARVLLRELRDGEWVPLTNRVDEAAGVLEDVLGLGLDQFTKLVLLPQGDFAAFLRSDAETRRRLLERLFGTDRFADVQQWLRESQNLLRQEVDQARERVAHLLARAQQAAGTAGVPVPLPSDDDGVDPLEQLGGLRAGVAAALEEARARRVAAQERARHVDDEHRAAVQLATLQERRQELLGRRERLDAARAAHEGRRARLVAAVRVAGLARWLEPLAAARSRSAAALIAMDAALVEFAEADPGFASSSDTSHAIGGPAEGGQAQLELPFEGAESPDDARLQGRRQAALELVGELAAVERRAADAARVSRELAAARRTATRLQAERTAADVELARCEDELRQTAAALADALAAAAALGSASARLERAREVARAAAEVRAQKGRCAELSERAAGLRRRRDDLRERWLDLRQRRLEGMAAELARTLALGAPCPVCGSAEHPSPAPGAAGGVDEAAEREAEHAVAAAQDELAGCERELTEARALAAAASAAAGGTGLEQALAACAGLEREVADAEVAGTRAATLEASLARQETARDAARSRCEAAATAGAGADGEVTRLEERHGALVKLLSAAADGYASVAARKAAAVRAAAAAEQLLTARAELRAATEQLAEVTRAARAAAGDAGFADLESACEAALGPAEVDLLEEQCRAHEQEDAVVTAALADPALLAAATAPPARPAVIALAADLARADDEAAAAALDRCLTAATGLAELETALTEHLTAVAPLLERYRLESELARCLDGTGGDNTLRMSLSSYVLAARLEQVAAAASERLQAMSGGRYSLVHCDEAERGRGRSGLSLRVVDGWTGRQRDTASLSGGESFYTSLALALGLADVVTAEAGGASVETLFVDEGFGSLDEDTLGEVMDVLDALRSGGRVVGLVSHVADMRDRIPARLEVVKTPTGSTLRQASA